MTGFRFRLIDTAGSELEFRRWEGHNPDASGWGATDAHLNCAIDLAMRECRAIELELRGPWTIAGEGAEFDAARRELERVRLETDPDRWDEHRQVYVVDDERIAQLREIKERNPRVLQLLAGAEEILAVEFKRKQGRADKLEKDLSEGDGSYPRTEKLRRMVHKWRKSGKLPT